MVLSLAIEDNEQAAVKVTPDTCLHMQMMISAGHRDRQRHGGGHRLPPAHDDPRHHEEAHPRVPGQLHFFINLVKPMPCHRPWSGLSPDGGRAADLAVWDALPEHAAAGGDALLAVPLPVPGDLQSHEHGPLQGKQPGRGLCDLYIYESLTLTETDWRTGVWDTASRVRRLGHVCQGRYCRYKILYILDIFNIFILKSGVILILFW